MDWAIFVEVAVSGGSKQYSAEKLRDRLSAHAPAVTCGQSGLTAQITVEADSAFDAIQRTFEIFRKAYTGVGEIIRVEVVKQER